MSLLSTTMKKPEEADIKIVKYELNTLENLKKAKENLTRDEIPTRRVTDEVNTTLELHPALYLEVKKSLQHIKKGGESKDDGLGVKMIVTYIRRNQTPKGDSPGAIVRLNVTNLQTGEASKCAVHYYHTKQNIHLQGGHRMGKVTTTSLVADFLLKEFSSVLQTRRGILVMTTDIIQKMDLEKFEQETNKENTNKKPSESSTMVSCDECSYKSIYEWNVIRHKKMKHEQEIITGVKRSLESKTVSFEKNTVKPVNTSASSSPPGKKNKDETNDAGKINTEDKNVEQEIVAVVESLEDTNSENEKKIKELQGSNTEKTTKIRMLSEKVEDLEIKLNEAQHYLKETIAERDLIRGEYNDMYKAAEQLNKDKSKVETDFTEVVQKINQSTRENEEMRETLKVTEDILMAMEGERRHLEEEDDNEDDEDEEVMEGDWAENQEAKVAGSIACKKCDKKFGNNKDLTEHLKTHVRTYRVQLNCHYCEFKTDDGNGLLDHISDSHIKTSICHTCKKSFRGKEALTAHVIAEHAMKSVQKTDRCSECGKIFPTVEALISHLVKDHYLVNPQRADEVTRAGSQLEQNWAVSGSSIKCYDCNETVVNKSELVRHKRQNHYKQKMCRAFHEYGHCERSDEVCNFIHRPQERHTRLNSWGGVMCRNGSSCVYRAQNRCKFNHSTPAAFVERRQHTQRPLNNTSEDTMKAVLDRLVRIEQMVPDLRSLTDFPQIGENRRFK